MLILHIYIQPGATKSEMVGYHGGRLKIRLQAPPIEGKANKALINFLAKYYSVRPSKVKILSGEKSRFKTVQITIE